MRMRPSAPGVVFALLAVATLAAFAWSQRLKRDPLVLDRATFAAGVAADRPRSFRPGRALTPNGDCRNDRERIRFRVTRSDRATVQIVKPGGRLVITLARDEPVRRYRYTTLYWDGHSRYGGTAPPGRYKLRVKLLGQDRTLVPPGTIRIHRAPRRPPASCEAQ